MKIIHKGRGEGKTTELIKMADVEKWPVVYECQGCGAIQDGSTGRCDRCGERGTADRPHSERYRSRYIICANHDMAWHTMHMARQLGIKIAFPITFSVFVAGKYCASNIDMFLIDNLDRCVQDLSRGGTTIGAISLTRDDTDG